MSTETWRFINTFAPWASAVGTIAAVVVSLYLSRANKPIKLDLRAGHTLLLGQGTTPKDPEYLYISATNSGHRVATITNVGWKVGLFKKRHAIQVVQKDMYSSGIPAKVEDGEEAKWMIPLDVEDNWLQRFSRDFLQPFPRWQLLWLRLQIHTSVGKTFSAKIEPNLRAKLLEESASQHGKNA